MLNRPQEIANKFYSAFQQRDAMAMKSCYHPELHFEDPAFGRLNYAEATDMWQMLCESASDLDLTFDILSATDQNSTTRWIAKYTFSKTNRKVVNTITADMEFKDGLIVKHIDSFDLYKWAKQALGFSGLLLGWTSYFRRKIQQQTNRQLQRFREKNSN